MNYKKIHDKTVEYIRCTTPKDRIFKRNQNDYRLNFASVYVEIHHIIPRSLGGVDAMNNLVEVLPEEHIFLHMLRYKLYRKREDALAVRFMLNGFDSENVYKNMKIFLTKKIRMGYSWLRSHAQFLRKTEGWHTEGGRNRISESRKGTMPVKDTNTNEIIGSVSVNHPNVISGKWVHHSKGRKQSQQEINFKKEHNKGQNNPNASGLDENYFIQKGVEMYKEFGIILSWGRMLELSNSRNFPWIKSLKSRFGGKSFAGYYEQLEKLTRANYNQYESRAITKRGISLS